MFRHFTSYYSIFLSFTTFISHFLFFGLSRPFILSNHINTGQHLFKFILYSSYRFYYPYRVIFISLLTGSTPLDLFPFQIPQRSYTWAPQFNLLSSIKWESTPTWFILIITFSQSIEWATLFVISIFSFYFISYHFNNYYSYITFLI